MKTLRLTVMVAAMVAAFAAQAAGKTSVPAAPASAPAAAPAAPKTGVAGYGVKLGGFFNDQHKQSVRTAFRKTYAKGDCPDEMERNGKTCKPLVEGHYWAVGQPLQKAVKTFPLPEPVKAALPAPPDGYEYVRAGDDILLLSSNGIHLVVDVLEDISG